MKQVEVTKPPPRLKTFTSSGINEKTSHTIAYTPTYYKYIGGKQATNSPQGRPPERSSQPQIV